ncbi:hydroxymethylbilane synthase [Rhodomicrobium lacus]|uniref:hydroxymethylbilane synthase n=1 Tax=Rhodomicrobium lacus TaxID=2498452 RepID=UPI000F8D36F4|nr:hydroxymethylbilane synthase [Rhodomicrobium lacus]
MKNHSDARQIRIGTRGSALALAQATEVQNRLAAIYGDEVQFERVVIKTTGDKILDKALSLVGGKGLFTKELEEALFADQIDIAVHSMKDVQAFLPDGLEIACNLPREDVRDAFISTKAKSLSDLPEGAVVGTASIRREAFIKNKRPDLKTVLFRGNVQSRLRKLEEGVADATLLASAGLNRLGLSDRITDHIPVEEMLPAPAQGAIGIEIRSDDQVTRELIMALHDEATGYAINAERAFLSELDGSCRTPIAALARYDGHGKISFKGAILTPDGARIYETTREGSANDAAAMGKDAAKELFAVGGKDCFPATE